MSMSYSNFVRMKWAEALITFSSMHTSKQDVNLSTVLLSIFYIIKSIVAYFLQVATVVTMDI